MAYNNDDDKRNEATKRRYELQILHTFEQGRASQAFQKALEILEHTLYTQRRQKASKMIFCLLHSTLFNRGKCFSLCKGKNEIYLSPGHCTHAPRLTQTDTH